MRVLLFAHLKNVAGRAEFDLTLEQPVDVDGLWVRLRAVHPELERFRSCVRLALHSEYVGREACFTDADEVALIPPVSGG